MPGEENLFPGEGHAILLGGKRRELRYTPRAQVELKRRYGKPMVQVLFEVSNFDTDALAHLLWAGLLHREPDLDVEQVVDWMEASHIQGYMARAMDAFQHDNKWLGSEKEKEKNGTPEKKERPSPGPSSGRKSARPGSTKGPSGARPSAS